MWKTDYPRQTYINRFSPANFEKNFQTYRGQAGGHKVANTLFHAKFDPKKHRVFVYKNMRERRPGVYDKIIFSRQI